MKVRHLMVVVTAAFLPLCALAEETPNVFDCVYVIAGGCEYEEWCVRSGSFVFDNSFGPFTNGVFYSRNDGGSHVLTGLCMKVLHKGTMESARSQIRGMQGTLTKELSFSHGGIEFSVESDAENLFVLRCPDIDGYENSCTFVARRSADGDPVEMSCDIVYVGPSQEEIKRRRHYLCDHRDEIESYIRKAVIGPFSFLNVAAPELIARLCKKADAKIKERYDVDFECMASFNSKTNYSFCICTTNIYAAFEVVARTMGLGIALDGNEISISPHLIETNQDTMCPEPLLIRSSCPTPSGLGRLGDVFPRDFINARFNERVSEVGLPVSTDMEFTNECYIVTRDLIRPYHECRKAKLYYDKKSGKLYSVRYSVKLNGFPRAQEYLRIAREIAKDLGFWYRLQFTKEFELDGSAIGSAGENGIVLQYRSKDETFPICIEVRNVKGRLQIDVSITNVAVLGRVRFKTVSVDNQIEVEI